MCLLGAYNAAGLLTVGHEIPQAPSDSHFVIILPIGITINHMGLTYNS